MMKLARRRVPQFAAAIIATARLPYSAFALDYPTRRPRWVVSAGRGAAHHGPMAVGAPGQSSVGVRDRQRQIVRSAAVQWAARHWVLAKPRLTYLGPTTSTNSCARRPRRPAA